jgi:hypothetical protein
MVLWAGGPPGREGHEMSAPRFTKTAAKRLHAAAHEAGMRAGNAARPVPMHVVQRANPFDDTSRVVRAYAPVMDGVCGFAYVSVRPGSSSFARWLKANAGGFSRYYGGVQFSVHEFGQSLERKAAYAAAYVEVVRAAGVEAFPESRMD